MPQMNNQELLLKIKQSIMNRITVYYNGNPYFPIKLIWYWKDNKDVYSVQLADVNAKSSTVEVSIRNISFYKSIKE